MRRGVLVVSSMLATVAVAAATAVAAAAGTVQVHPGTGGPRTTFRVSVTLPLQTGSLSGMRRTDTLSVSGPRRSRCVSSEHTTLPAAPAGATVTRRLAPGRAAHWCKGTFNGTVVETQQSICGPPADIVCPMVVIAPQTIARFRFHVR